MAQKIPIRYLPYSLSKSDEKKQIQMLKKSRGLYKKHKYFTRKPLASYKNKTSKHILNARKIYGIDKITPSKSLAKATECSISALQKIVNKGEGAYFSSGSRPNQTARSWGLARLASSITGGKSAAVDFKIIDEGCKHSGRAYNLATKSRKKYGYGQGHAKTRKVNL